MKHLADDDLVLYYYAEGGSLPEARAHLEACGVCRERLADLESALSAVLSSAVPERGESYGREVWARVRPQLGRRAGVGRVFGRLAAGWLTPPRLAFAGGVAMLVVAAFAAGRYWPAGTGSPGSGAGAVARDAAARDADSNDMLLASVGGHLERSAMVLAEVVNRPDGRAADVSAEQMRAGDLVATNRLIRQSAVRQGEGGLASVLEDLERVLVEITNAPSPMPAADLDRIRQRIRDRGLLFKVRVMETQLRERQRDAAAAMPAVLGKKS